MQQVQVKRFKTYLKQNKPYWRRKIFYTQKMPATPKKYWVQTYFWSWNIVQYLQHLQLHTVTPQL